MERWSGELPKLSGERRAMMAFLEESLPKSDWDSYPPALFLAFVDHALALRREAPWCAALDEELFRHYVLCPRVNDEDLSFHRALFHDALWERVEGLSQAEAVLEVNRWCQEQASYQQQDDRTASPLTVYRCGSGRCGEESAFLVSALRSVGLAARQVYAPRWSHCDDNHAWAEALVDGQWRFLGACEPEPVLDRGWFNTAAGRAVLIHSRTFGAGTHPLHGESLGNTNGVSWYNQTPRYARTVRRTFRVLRGGAPVPGAALTLSILNEAAFYPVARLRTGTDGTASANLGLGDVWVSAALDGLGAEGLGRAEEGALTLELTAPAEMSWRMEFDFRAPADSAVNQITLTEKQKKSRAGDRARGDALRQNRLDGFFDPLRAASCPGCEDLLREARGNFDEIYRFLTRSKDPLRERLLRTLSKKDLRDVRAEALEDHLTGAAPFAGAFPAVVFDRYLLCPRVADEPLTAWRTALAQAPAGFTPEACEGNYEGLYWPPDAVLAAGRCDRKSRDVFTVARLRSKGVPARLRPLDGVPEVWEAGAFRPVEPEAACTLMVAMDEGEEPPVYRQGWSLSRRTAEGWRLLQPCEESWEEGALLLKVPAGEYRLLTSVRLPSGDQLATRQTFTLREGEAGAVPLRPRRYALSEMLDRRTLPTIQARAMDGTAVENALAGTGRPTLLLWLEDGAEPTEHVLNELMEAGTALSGLDVKQKLFLRGREAVEQRTLAALLENDKGISLYIDDWAYDLEQLSRFLGQDPDRPPLMIVADGDGNAVYADCGYRVGAVGLAVRILAHLCGG